MGSEGRWPAVSGGPPDTFVHFFNPPFRGLEMRVLEFSPGRRKQPAGRRRSPRKGMVPAQTPRLDLPAGRQKSGRYGSQQRCRYGGRAGCAKELARQTHPQMLLWN